MPGPRGVDSSVAIRRAEYVLHAAFSYSIPFVARLAESAIIEEKILLKGFNMKTNTIEKTTAPATQHSDHKSAELILRRVNQIVQRDLELVITPDKNINASNDLLFRHQFGRDTAISADRLLLYDQAIAHQAITLLFSNQGAKTDKTTGERPGKIFHEFKERGDDPEQQAIFDSLRTATGIGDDQNFASYTSVDATPEAIHLVARYAARYGKGILREKVNRQGKKVTIEQCVKEAAEWIQTLIAHSDIGLIGTRRSNPRSVTVADLLDGATSFMHADGVTLVNHTAEVDTINFQAIGYQAFTDAAELAGSKKERRVLQKAAKELRQKTIEYFWMPEKARVAMAIDRDSDGQPRRLETDTILPAVALRTGIFDDRPDIVEAIFKGLYTPEMMTCVGPRTQSLATDAGYTRYQEPPWPVLVGRVVDGAMRYEQDAIAIDLIERMLMGIYTTGKSEEFHQVTKDNELGIYANHQAPGTKVIVATNKPEAPQAWTAATLWAMTHEVLPILAARQHTMKHTLQTADQIDLSINKVLKTVPYTLDRARAQEIEKEILRLAKNTPPHSSRG